MTENPYEPPRASCIPDDSHPLPSTSSSIVLAFRVVAAMIVGIVIGFVIGREMFGMPFGMGDDSVPVGGCTLLGAITGFMFELHRIRRRPTGLAKPTFARKAGRAIRELLDQWT